MARSGFTKKKIGSMTLGEKLQQIRSERRISLTEVSRSTKIQVKYLESLEKGDYESLPPDVYVRGFLKSYAQFLGLQEESLIRLYERDRSIQEKLNKNDFSTGKEAFELAKYSKFVVTPKILAVAVMILLFAGGGFYLYRELGKFSSAPRLILKTPENNISSPDNFVDVSGFTDQDATLYINDQAVVLNDQGEFNQKVNLKPGLNQIAVKSVNRFNKEAEKTLQINSEAEGSMVAGAEVQNMDAIPEGAAQEGIVENLILEMSIENFPTWLEVEADDNLVFSGTVKDGESKTFEAREKISVTSGKGANVKIKLNGIDKGALSNDPGVVKDRVFTKENI